jgi:hypothetical protein
MGNEVNVNREYKSSLFSDLFSEYPDELPKAFDISIRPDAMIKDVTLDNVLYMEQINDLALWIDTTLLLFFEHQSTINHNMCVRLLLYCARTYEKVIDRNILYQKNKIIIPRPIFFVLYNGKDEFPDTVKLNLSDSFDDISGLLKSDAASDLLNIIPLELSLTVININKGRNSELIAKSEILSGYVEFVDRANRYKDAGMVLSEAITKAIRECINEGILKEYLLNHASEVENMLLSEWDTKTCIEVRAKESYDQAKAEDKAMIDQVVGERDQIAGERDQIAGERDQIAGERDQIAGERDRLAAEIATLRAQLAEKRQ